jgi:hypothetical protein
VKNLGLESLMNSNFDRKVPCLILLIDLNFSPSEALPVCYAAIPFDLLQCEYSQQG